MKTKNYLPLAAYRFGAIGALLQVGIALGGAATTLPGYRTVDLYLAAVHLGLMLFWMHQYRKAKRWVPTRPVKVMSLPAARGLMILAICGALLMEGMVTWSGYELYLMGLRYQMPLQVGTVLSQLSMHVNALMGGAILITVAQRSLNEAKAAALKSLSVQEEQSVAAPVRSTWWTQDETRQELRRK